jgi:ABC-type glycerol-3-phosphate transport system permease component
MALWSFTVALALLVVMLAFEELGYRLGAYNARRNPQQAYEGLGAVEAAVFALLGLLLAFSFSDGMDRLADRRKLIIEETNAIETAYLRLDLLPAAERHEMRLLFREYLDARLHVYDNLTDADATSRALDQAAQLQQKIWSQGVRATQAAPSEIPARLLLPALNEMIDVTTARTIALQTHLPMLIFVLLTCVAILSAVLAGYAMAKRGWRSWFHSLLYAAVIAATIYTVLDLDHPRIGLIRLDSADRALKNLRDSINE